jgi:hypothetical protein
MRMTLTRLTAAATLAVGALLAALALAPAASAAKLGGKTIVAPEPATIDALAAAGVTVTRRVLPASTARGSASRSPVAR